MRRVGTTQLLLCALLSLLLVGIGFGQETTGTVRGAVTDPTGAAIVGAAVELSGGQIPRPYTTTTDQTGSFRLAQIPPGSGYTLSVTSQGFRTSKSSGLAVELGKATSIDIRLEVGNVAESVVVSADAVMVDTQSSQSAVTVDKSFFDLIPKGRSFYDLIGIAPGARNETKAGGFEIDGASGSENTYYLDGMEVTGIQQGTLSGQAQIPTQMVQQVEVKNGVMEAQYGGAMGGVVNAVVRSGGNDFHGQVGFYYNNDAMQAQPRPILEVDPLDPDAYRAMYFHPKQDTFHTWEPLFNVGGPLIKNRLFFFAGYSPVKTYTNRTVDFVSGDKGTYTQNVTQQFLSTKVDFVPFEKLRASMSWVRNPQVTRGILPSVLGTDAFSNNWGEQGNHTGGNVLAGSLDYLATSKLIFSFRGGWHYQLYNNNYGIPNSTAIYYSQSNLDPTKYPNIPDALRHSSGWLQQAVGLTKWDDYQRKNYSADVSYLLNFHGQHSLKGGWQRNDLMNDVFISNYPNGYYRYYWSSATTPAVYHCVTSQCTTGTGTFGYYRYRVLGTIGKGASQNQGIFVQDNWRVNKHLTVNLGLRTEREFVPIFSPTGKSPFPPIKFSWSDKLSPRIGGAYDLMGDGKTRIYASFGRFFDIMKYEMPRGSFGGDVWKEYYYSLDDPNLVNSLQGFAADPMHLPGTFFETVDWRIPSQDPAQHLVDPNLKPVAQQMMDIGFDHSISSTLVASVRYTNRRLIRTIEDTGYMGAGGETYLIANPGEGFTGNRQAWTDRWQGVVLPLPPKPERKYDAVEFRLDKRFSTRYQFSASYTYSRLWGNYSGLASSDEDGRTSPNVNRYYDMPWVGVMENGKYAYGRLATDRPHTFKFFGLYSLNSKLGVTTFSPIANWYSGTPITTEANLVSSTPAFPYGRGDLGRTPMFFNTDFNVAHDFVPVKSRESLKVRIEASIFNLFNSETVTNKYKIMVYGLDGQIQFNDANGDPSYPTIFQGFNAKQLMAEQVLRQDPQYGMASGFQGPRSVRLQLSFMF